MLPVARALNQMSIRAFNSVFHDLKTMKAGPYKAHYEPFLYPLDAIANWNRLYGKNGFYQYQCVLPPGTARDGTIQLLNHCGVRDRIFPRRAEGLRRQTGTGLLSFPREGTTLALDFQNKGEETLRLMSDLDRIVSEAVGAFTRPRTGASRLKCFGQLSEVAGVFCAYRPWPFLGLLETGVDMMDGSIGRCSQSWPKSWAKSWRTVETTVVPSNRVIIWAHCPPSPSPRRASMPPRVRPSCLAARNEERLKGAAADLRARGAVRVEIAAMDLEAAAYNARARLAFWSGQLGGVDHVHVIYGYLGAQDKASSDPAELARIVASNFSSAVQWCEAAAEILRRQKHGSIVAVSSVVQATAAGNRTMPMAPPRAGLRSMCRGWRTRWQRSARGPWR